MKVLVTGTTGFIGSHVAIRLLERGDQLVSFDNLNEYCDANLKKARVSRFHGHPNYAHPGGPRRPRTRRAGVRRTPAATVDPPRCAAGVRYAAEDPHVCVSINVTGFLNVLEGFDPGVGHLVFPLDQLCVWCEHEDAVRRALAHRAPADAVRQLRTRPTSWRTPTRTCSERCAPGCSSSRCPAPGAARTWRCSSSRRRCWPASR